ncbi:MAG: hypothetical protein AAF744_07810 [Pseudomonadota bacterium]
MSFLRPEARTALWRWREVLVGTGLLLGGLWLVAGPGRLMVLPGYAGLAVGAGLIWLGVQRARFRGPEGGVGAVQVDEGRVTYFGPLSGGTIALRELQQLSLERATHPAHWRLDQPGQPPLLIPVDAAGAEALFDAFASLPGLKTERMLAELQATRDQPVVIWQRQTAAERGITLH